MNTGTHSQRIGFIIESENVRGARKQAGTWRSGVPGSAWMSARDAHFCRFRVCHCGDDADDDDGRALILRAIDPCT